MIKVAFWIKYNRFCNLFYNLREARGIRFYLLVPNIGYLNGYKNVHQIGKNDVDKIREIIKECNISTIISSHINEGIFKIKAKHIFMAHGMFDYSDECTKCKESINFMRHFDKVIVPGKISREIMINYFGVKDKNIIDNIYVPFDKLYDISLLHHDKKQLITIIDHGITWEQFSEAGNKYNDIFRTSVKNLSKICEKNNYILAIKLKDNATKSFMMEGEFYKDIFSKVRIKFFDYDDLSYLKESEILFVVRSPSIEIESLFFEIPVVIVRDKKDDYNRIFEYDACFRLNENDINIDNITKIINDAKTEDFKHRKKKYIDYLGLEFDNKNFEKLTEFIKKESV